MNFDRLTSWQRFGLLLMIFLPAGCQARPQDGLVKFPVTGAVFVDGEPAAGVAVRFFRGGLAGNSNADTPSALTGADGRFALSTNYERDGAVAGEYKVTFTWKESNSPAAVDRLMGRYTSLPDSPFVVSVLEAPTELLPFELTTDEVASKPGKQPVAGRKRRYPGLPPTQQPN